MDQRTDTWFEARLGKVTASRIGDLLATTKTGPSASRKNYAAQLVCERLTGAREEHFVSAAMNHGIDTEAQARAAYEFTQGLGVMETGFHDHPTIPMCGASPDGLVGDDGLIEIKCPNSATHIAALEGAKIDRKYLLQMQWQMACTERLWCDFASFDPRLPLEMQLHVRRVERNAGLLAEIEAEVKAFLTEVDSTVASLRARYLQMEAA